MPAADTTHTLHYTFPWALHSPSLVSWSAVLHFSYCCAVAAGRPLTVTCTRPTTGWIPFRLNLTATSPPNSCGATGQAVLSTAFNAPQRPSLNRTSPTTFSLCALSPNVTLTYALSSAVDGAQFGMVPTTTNATVACIVTPSNASEWGVCVCGGGVAGQCVRRHKGRDQSLHCDTSVCVRACVRACVCVSTQGDGCSVSLWVQ